MTYSVKEIFYTLQGEGAQAGRPAVFCRFTGCNLWSGLERDRQTAICNFCDTDFVGTDGEGGGKFATPAALVKSIVACWPARLNTSAAPYVVFTGGEPLLQLDTRLIEALHEKGFEIAVETNGTLEAPPGIDWICVSPKATAPVTLSSGNELKLVYPQPSAMPDRFSHLARSPPTSRSASLSPFAARCPSSSRPCARVGRARGPRAPRARRCSRSRVAERAEG